MAKDYIPRANSKFDTFQSILVKMVVANATAWKIPMDEVNALKAASIKYSDLYKAISIKGNRTQGQVAAHDEFREKTYEPDFRVFVNSFIKTNKNIDVSALSAMGITERKKRRKQRSKIETTPQVFIENIANMWLRFICRVESHYGKGSIRPESYGLEFRYSIGTKPATPKKNDRPSRQQEGSLYSKVRRGTSRQDHLYIRQLGQSGKRCPFRIVEHGL